MKNKQSILFLILFIFSISVSRTQIFQSSPEELVGTGQGYNHPQISLNSNGQPLILWTDGSTKNCYINLRDPNLGFQSAIRLNPIGLPIQTYNWSGPDLARWNKNIYVTLKADGYETGHLYLLKSIDDGQTFGDTVRIDQLTSGFGQYPDVAVFNDTVFVTFMKHDAAGMNPQYVVSRSVDGGATFEQEVEAGSLKGNEACDCCPPELIVNEKFVILLWRNNNNNVRDIKGVISYDRGASFTQIISVDDHQWVLQSCPSTGPDPHLNGTQLYTVYKTQVSGADKVFLNHYDLQSLQTTNLIDLGENIVNSINYPQISGSNDTIGVVFEAIEMSTDVFFMASYNGSQGMNIQNRINLTKKSSSQNKPDIAFKNGLFHVVYNDLTQLKYIQLSPTAGIDELKKEKKTATIILSKTLGDKLKTPSEGIYLLLDLKGQIQKIQTNENQEIDISKLTAGSYFLISQNQEINYHQAIIITP